MEKDIAFEEIQSLENEYVMPTFARKNVEFVSGEGVHLYDDKGNKYLDFLAGIAVCSLGHCNKSVVSAIQNQAQNLMHVSNYFYIEKRGEVAHKISNLLNNFDEKLPAWKTFFANSGAEANECALKIARYKANKAHDMDGLHTLVVTLKNSFHGRTLETLAATAQDKFHVGFKPMSCVFVEVEANDEAGLRRIFEEHEGEICAMIIEPIQGESGVHPCNESFAKLARDLTKSENAALICDEVQTGIFRTGRPFAFHHFEGVVPDIVTIAKGVADGFPAGACAARGEFANVFEPGDHGSTFGGSNLAIAAINATLDELCHLEIGKHVCEMEEYMRNELSHTKGVASIRGKGLMLGCQLEAGINAFEVVDKALYTHNLIINATSKNVLRFVPPLIVEREDISEFSAKLQASIAACR